MACLTLTFPQEKWHYPLVIAAIFILISWYIINTKKASAKDNILLKKDVELSDAKAGELSLLTYNVAGLPQVISSAKLPRAQSMRTIGMKVSKFDIVNVQEDFNYNSSLYSYNIHPFRTHTKGKVPFGDGLNTLSRYPILEIRRVPWNHCSGTDCLTPKGFAYIRVQLAKEVFLDIYNLHATSQINTKAVESRRHNLKQLANYINEHSANHPLIVMGDFNAHYGFIGDNMHDFKQQTQLVDPWVGFYLEGIIPSPSEEFLVPDIMTLTSEVESIDKILYRSSNELIIHPKAYAIEDQLFVNEEGKALSDHLAVSLVIEWELKSDEEKR